MRVASPAGRRAPPFRRNLPCPAKRGATFGKEAVVNDKDLSAFALRSFWVMTPSTLAGANRRFGGTYASFQLLFQRATVRDRFTERVGTAVRLQTSFVFGRCYLLSWFSSVILDKYLKSTSIRPRALPSKSFPIHDSAITRQWPLRCLQKNIS